MAWEKGDRSLHAASIANKSINSRLINKEKWVLEQVLYRKSLWWHWLGFPLNFALEDKALRKLDEINKIMHFHESSTLINGTPRVYFKTQKR